MTIERTVMSRARVERVAATAVLRGSIVLQLSVVHLGEGSGQSLQKPVIRATYETMSTVAPAISVCFSVHKSEAQQPLAQDSIPGVTPTET